jgi:hypothetical protein
MCLLQHIFFGLIQFTEQVLLQTGSFEIGIIDILLVQKTIYIKKRTVIFKK